MADYALPPARRIGLADMLDLVERGVLSLLFARLVARNWPTMFTLDHWFNFLLVVSEGMVVALLLVRRRSQDFTRRPADWVIAAVATVGPLLVQPGGGEPLIPPGVGAVLLVGGLFLQIGAKLVLGRSFGIVAANRGVKAVGPYRIVRHPMYLGYMGVQVGYLLLAPNLFNLGLYVVSYTAQVMRLLAEERLLARDAAYRAYQTGVRWRLLPGVF